MQFFSGAASRRSCIIVLYVDVNIIQTTFFNHEIIVVAASSHFKLNCIFSVVSMWLEMSSIFRNSLNVNKIRENYECRTVPTTGILEKTKFNKTTRSQTKQEMHPWKIQNGIAHLRP